MEWTPTIPGLSGTARSPVIYRDRFDSVPVATAPASRNAGNHALRVDAKPASQQPPDLARTPDKRR
jgi:hypothetical protein